MGRIWGGEGIEHRKRTKSKSKSNTTSILLRNMEGNSKRMRAKIASGERNEEEDFFYHSLYKL